MRFVLTVLFLMGMAQTQAQAGWVPEVEGYCPVPKEIFAFDDMITFNESGVFYIPEDEGGSQFKLIDDQLVVLLFSGEEEVLVQVEFHDGDEQGPEATLTVDGVAFKAQCFYGIPN